MIYEKKFAIYGTLAVTLCCGVVYLLSAFISWDFDPAGWGEHGRVAAAGFAFMLSYMSAFAVLLILAEGKK